MDGVDTTTDIYWSEVSSLPTPNLWNYIGTTSSINVPMGNTLVVSNPPLVWNSDIPPTGHYCFVGITGNPDKIFLLSKSWGILSQKIFLENGEYNIDHSSPVILLKDGKYVARISPRDDIKRSIKIIKKHL